MTLAQDLLVTWPEPAGIALRGVVVVLPGRGESAAVYERLGRRLAGEAYRVQVAPAPTGSTDRTAAALSDAFEGVDPALPRVVLGADAGAAYAAHRAATGGLEGVSALVLAGLPVAGDAAAVTDWDGELELRTACPTHRGRIGGGVVTPAALFDEVPAAWLDPAVAAAVGVPVLGLHGRDDAVSPVERARRWFAGVPRAELVTVVGGRHDVLNDVTHRSVGATISLFLERLKAGADLAPIAVTESSAAATGPRP